MPTFTYDTRPNPFVGSIGDVMLRRGDIAAQQALTAANAGAAATIAGGNAYGGAVRDIGQSVAGTIAHATDPRVKAEQIQLTEAQDAQRSRNVLEAELKNPANFNPDGTVNDDAVRERLKKQDVGAWQTWDAQTAAKQKAAVELQERVLTIQKTGGEIADRQRSLQQAQSEALGKIAYNALGVLNQKPDDPLHARDTLLSSVAHAATLPYSPVSPDDAKAIILHAAQASPDQIRTLLTSVIPPDLKNKLDKEAADTKKSMADADKAQAEADVIRRNGGIGVPPAAQAKAFRVKMPGGGTQDVPLEFVPGRSAEQPGAYYLNKPDGTRQQMFPGRDFTEVPSASVQVNTNATAAMKNMPGWALDASRPSGAEGNILEPTLRMTPNGLFQDAQNFITSGQYPPTGRGNDEAAQLKRAAIDSKVGAIAAAAGMDVPALRAFYRSNADSLKKMQTSLDSVQSFMATADKNVDLLQKILPKVPDVGSPIFNQPLRAFEKNVLGNEDLSQMATFLKSAQNEYARIVSQPNLAGQLTDSARGEAEQLLASDATVGQMIKSIQALKAEGTNRVTSLGEQIQKIGARMQTPPPAGAGPTEGAVQPIPGHPGTEQTFKGGKWIRTK